jgi:excisionase family DNA binding protein
MSRGTSENVRPHRDDLLGAKEAAEILGVPRSSLSRWLESGRLRPYGLISASPVFRQADIERFKEERDAIEQARQDRREREAAAA